MNLGFWNLIDKKNFSLRDLHKMLPLMNGAHIFFYKLTPKEYNFASF